MENHINPVFTEDNQNRDQCAYMKQDVQHLHGFRICPDAQKKAGEQEMAA